MNIDPIVIAYVAGVVLGLVALFFIVRFAVQAGVTVALRRHEAWMRDGSLEDYLDTHAEQLAKRAEQREADRRQLGL